ncbi:aminotransferase class III-fold pyridoxal phosphate-dependent enzyme [Marivibrio halodurans]|uniref:Aminotransferase class III-fold pyridoxal phosphate-dependent enzyme n=2 Tax=Marivibrio halodurans TaxID=2039722 RepID=A0A8J7SLC6_9PROT|nr:aminotransferase class III-fold pyridoxal phosphate-dependent enzyme [Marivibrio halodurans]
MPFTANRDFKASPRLVVKSEGVYLWNHEGGRLIDGSSSLFNVACGHGRKEIAEAVSQQLHECDYSPSFQMGHPWSFELAQKVTRLTPDEINHVFFTNSGSESIDTALKMAMAYHRARGDGQRLRFVSRERAYHGVNMGGVSLAGMVKNRETFQAVLPNVVHMRHTWLDANRYQWGQGEHGADLAEDLQRAVDTYGGTTIAACFVEPIAGSTGCLVPPKGYLERLREICDANGILLVFDEVITGFGRLGKPFAAQAFGVTPDIMTMAKAITNGAQPMGAVAVKDSLYETITEAAPEDAIEFFHGYTYSGHPAACAAGIATMDIYEREGLFDRAAKLAPYFEEKMMGLKDIDAITDIRGYGLMSAFDIKGDGNAMQKIFFKNGLHVKFTGNAGIVAPPLVVEEAQIDDLVAVIRKCLTEN